MGKGSDLIAKIGLGTAAIGAVLLYYIGNRGDSASIGFLICITFLVIGAIGSKSERHQ